MKKPEVLSPSPKAGFETEVIHELLKLTSELSAEKVAIHISRFPGHPELPQPCFVFTPANPRAAELTGSAVNNDLYLGIGPVEQEFINFAKGQTICPGFTWQQDLKWIWRAVISGGFSQRQSLDQNDLVIGTATKLTFENIDWVFRAGRAKESLFREARYRTVAFEPY